MDQFYVQLDRLDGLANTRLPAIAKSIENANAALKEATGQAIREIATRYRQADGQA